MRNAIIMSELIISEVKSMHECRDLIFLFNALFEHSENTILVGNGDEPLYLPSDESNSINRIIFTRDYFASALHEVAHWCIAGDKRRGLVDYGYWYYPEGRDAEQQALFQQAEVKPQAIEYLFSKAARFPFVVSVDDFSNEQDIHREAFAKKIKEQARDYLTRGLPKKAEIFRARLLDFYQQKANDLQR